MRGSFAVSAAQDDTLEMALSLLLLLSLGAPDLRLELTRESLTGTHSRYRQYIDGREVVGGEVNVTVRHDGSREEHRSLASEVERTGAIARGDVVWVNVDGTARLARRERDAAIVRYVAVDDGRLLRSDILEFRAKPARVFDPNPVAKLNAPELRDRDDAAAAVPPAAYSEVDISNARDSGPLGGPAVQIADFQAPFIAPVDAASDLRFDREASAFEDVNAFFHIDRSQLRLQNLGFTGPRAIAPYAVETDTHAAGGADDSFFVASSTVAGTGRLHFGEGGTDDAEDSDLVVHEYAHVIHEWISPGTFLGSFGSEARAIGEGFGDYWAFSAKYAAARASGRDPHCFADWDARCWEDATSERCAYPPGSDCLRRTDSARTIADYIRSESAGVEHRNGEIWSAAMTEIFLAMVNRYGVEAGRRATDMLAVEALFGTPPRAGFATVAKQMLAADQYLFGGTNNSILCAAMTVRGIVSDCVTAARGESTVFPGRGSGTVVPDNDPGGVTLSVTISDPRPIERLTVSVDIRHRGRGELRVALVAPDGTVVRLHEPGPERAPDLITTFGMDSLPVDSLDVFRGRSAAGVWQLRIVDVAFADVATVIGWSVNIEFEGQQPPRERPLGGFYRQIVPIVGHSAGANGTFFRTDLRLLNPADVAVSAWVVFTPTEKNGHTDFAATEVQLEPNRVVAFDDVVARLLRTGGIGSLEISSAVPITATTRTWTRANEGTFGFSLSALPPVSITAGTPQYIAGLRTTDVFRTNIGFVETRGTAVRAHVVLRSETSTESFSIDLQPLSHVQMPIAFAADPFVAEIRVEGPGWVIAYGAVIDNRSGDSMVLSSVRANPTGAIYPAIASPGANGTDWKTEMSIVSIDGAAAVSEHSYRMDAGAFHRELINVSFARIEDVITTLFERPGTMGTLTSTLPRNLIVSARVWTDGPGGTYGDAVTSGESLVRGASSPREILFIENSGAYRTNVGLYGGTTAGTVRATLFDADGEAVQSFSYSVQPFQLIQVPITVPIVNGRLRVEAGHGYAALVDNVTGDLSYVGAR